MPIDRKYGRVTLENQRNIGDDEPVFIFRAQDALLPELLWIYRKMCETAGSPANHLRGIDSARQEVTAWQSEHGHKLPDSKGYDPRA